MGYFAVPETPDPAPRNRREAILKLVATPDDESAIRLNVQVSEAEGGGWNVAAWIDPATLVFEQKKGQYTDELDFVIVAQKENGTSFPSRVQTYHISVPERAFREIVLQKGVSLSGHLTPQHGAHRLRVAVREVRRDTAGSVTVPLREARRQPSPATVGQPAVATGIDAEP